MLESLKIGSMYKELPTNNRCNTEIDREGDDYLDLAEVSDFDLLLRNDYIDGLIKDNNCFALYLEDVKRYPVFTPEEEKEVTSKLLGDFDKKRKAEQDLYLHNQRLVIFVAKKEFFNRNFNKRVLGFTDLINEGNLGLGRAIKKFDPLRGLKFSTYATWWIRQSVTRAILEKGNFIRLPVHTSENISKIKRNMNIILQRDGNMPFYELAKKLGFEPKSLLELLNLKKGILSLDQPLNDEDDDYALENVVGFDDEEEKKVSNFETEQFFNYFLATFQYSLTARQFLVLYYRSGYLDSREWTLEEIGGHLGITREGVRQIEKEALKKIRGNKAFMKELKKYFS